MRHILKLHRDLDIHTLPHPIYEFKIETFNIDRHKQEWLDLNNLIFAHHPDQGNWAMEDLENRMSEPWFDPQGFFLATFNGMINGFVWTKIHKLDEAPCVYLNHDVALIYAALLHVFL